VSPQDRGFTYGDGVFETMAVSGRLAIDLDLHLERLEFGLTRLGIRTDGLGELEREAMQLASTVTQAVLKIVVTRGINGRGYRTQRESAPTRVLSLHAFEPYPASFYREGITATLCRHRLPRHPALAGIKHLNRLDQVLARREWTDEYQEGLMLDTEGAVIEGVMSNVFALKGKRLSTPDLTEAGVAGITRRKILDAAAGYGLEPDVSRMMLADLEDADSLLFCNSLIGLWPVRRLAAREFGIADAILELGKAVTPPMTVRCDP